MVKVSVVIPVYNEENYIEECIKSILEQDYPKEEMEVLFVDGKSEDRTPEILKEYQKQYPWIRILENEKRIIPSALNIGITEAEGEIIVRMDAHSEYANDYISKCVEILEKTEMDNVGGPQITKGKTKKQRSIAAAYSSPFAVGSGKHFHKDYEGVIDTVFLGTFHKSFAVEMGLYDENMPRNEDDEFNFRISQNGGKVYMSPEIKVIYYPRDSFGALAKQYFGYGKGKPSVNKKHKKLTNFKQLIPALFVLFVILGLIASVVTALAAHTFIPGIIYLALLVLYLLANFIFSFTNKEVTGFSEKMGLFWTHIVMHVSYGVGYIIGLFSK